MAGLVAVLAALARLPATASAALDETDVARDREDADDDLGGLDRVARRGSATSVNLWQGGAPVSVPKTQTSTR